MKTICSTFFAVFLAVSLFAQTYTIETVPNTKLVNNSYVSNPDQIISPEAVGTIDSVLTALEKSATVQVAVVLLNSIGEEDHVDFAQRLFDHWGVGKAGNDNGVLVLLVKDQRTVRFHTGYGVEGVLPDAVCKRIQRERMVPYLKEDDYDQAMIEGVSAIAEAVNTPETFADEQEAESPVEDIPLYGFTVWPILGWLFVSLITFFVKRSRKSFAETANKNSDIPKAEFSSWKWLTLYVILPVAVMIFISALDNILYFLGGMYAYLGSLGLFRKTAMDKNAARLILDKNYQGVYNYYQEKQGTFNFLRFVFPIPFAFMYGKYKKQMEFFRNHPRNCKSCGKPLTKLDDHSDDKFLSTGQIREEQIKSVDYDVWVCNSCDTSETFIYKNPDTKYSTCPKCSFVTFYVVSNRTIRSATQHREGLGEEIKACKHCNHREVRSYTIAKVTPSSSSSGGGSSSSGGSWGGGRSGGGGASSSW